MRAQITGLKQAHINSSNGISVVQTAEGALAESHAILQRMGELAVESMNGIYEPEDRQKLDDEYQQLLEELDRISESTNFNGIKLLDGSLEKKAYTQEPVNVLADRTPEILAGARTAEASPSQRNRAIESYRSTLAAGPATTIPAGGDFAITSDGVYEIADGFTGKITIAAGAKVTLTQADPSVALHEVSIQCGVETDLTIRDLNIQNNTDINAIDFTGYGVSKGNALHIEGANIISAGFVAGGYLHSQAIIHAAGDTRLLIDGTGSLERVHLESGDLSYNQTERGAFIGGNANEDGGIITISGGTICAGCSQRPSGDYPPYNRNVISFGAVIGGGFGGSSGTITINDGTKLEVYGDQGAAIGSGSQGATSKIVINGGDIIAGSHGPGAAIGSGEGSNMPTPSQSGGLSLVINGGQIEARQYAGSMVGATIGGGCFRDGGDIRITGGTIKATSSGDAAAIGGGYAGNGGDIIISGGNTIANIRNSPATASHIHGAAIGGGTGCYVGWGSTPNRYG